MHKERRFVHGTPDNTFTTGCFSRSHAPVYRLRVGMPGGTLRVQDSASQFHINLGRGAPGYRVTTQSIVTRTKEH